MDMMTSVGDGSTARANGHDDGREARHCLRIHFMDGTALDVAYPEQCNDLERVIRDSYIVQFQSWGDGSIATINMHSVTYVERIYPDGLA